MELSDFSQFELIVLVRACGPPNGYNTLPGPSVPGSSSTGCTLPISVFQKPRNKTVNSKVLVVQEVTVQDLSVQEVTVRGGAGFWNLGVRLCGRG